MMMSSRSTEDLVEHGAKVDEEVKVTLARPKIVTRGGAEDVQPHHPVLAAQIGDGIDLVLDYCDHGTPP